MPNEALITQIENILSQVVDISGQQEITSIVTNLEVVDAAPTGLTGFVTIKDERDGDTVLAKTIPGIEYDVDDLVNVLFVNGTEPVAFQQASQSAGSNSLWQVVPSTSTDIFSNNGNVGIGTASPSNLLEIQKNQNAATLGNIINNNSVIGTSAGFGITVDTTRNAGLRLFGPNDASRPNAMLFFSGGAVLNGLKFEADAGNMIFDTNLTEAMRISSGQLVAIGTTSHAAKLRVDQASTTAAIPTLFLDQGDLSEQCIEFSSDATDRDINLYTVNVTGTPTLLWDESEDAFSWNKGLRVTSGNVGIGNAAPQEPLHVGPGTDASGIGSTVIYASNAGTTTISARDSTNDVEVFMLATAGLGLFGCFTNTDFELRTNNTSRLFIESTGEVGIGTVVPLARLHVDQPSATAAIPTLYLDQADVSEEMIEFATTIGTGNAIEAVGAKTLTVTHFIKVTLPGALTRYLEVGTIA